ncbi:phospholipid phosphatase 1-like [Battus philenor]|uniref:phospholipid phosphatase 1-like n=1 Tax=Battus philenor TaxID=42288 RepID=UPI0035CE9639
MMEKLKYFWTKTNRWHHVIFLFLVVELKVIPGGQLGFKCNDAALSHPYTGDTISWKWLLGVTVLLPLVVMLIIERQCHGHDKRETNNRNSIRWYKEYVYGLLVNLTIVQALKLAVGSPRPHFFDTCQPREALTCLESEYVNKYTCTTAYWLSQSDKSFPSGHTSLALHAALFVVYYLQLRATGAMASVKVGERVIRACQGACLALAFFCGVSRMWDHRHHWWDVLAGAAIAGFTFLYTIKSLCNDFQCSRSDVTSINESNTQSHSES